MLSRAQVGQFYFGTLGQFSIGVDTMPDSSTTG